MAQTILLVGHSTSLHTVVRLHLLEDDFELVEARDPDEALAALERRRCHLVIADLGGGQEQAVRFLERLRRAPEPAVRGLPVVVVSARPTTALEAAIAGASPGKVLPKPVTGPRLRAAIEGLVGRPPRG